MNENKSDTDPALRPETHTVRANALAVRIYTETTHTV